MINERDVIWMRVAYPSISERLAYVAHMYICNHVDGTNHSFVKCQTLKPYMLNNPDFQHYVDERADINRNPFKHTTRIDCDKQFVSQYMDYDEKMKTRSRPDVCPELFESVRKELEQDGYTVVVMDQSELLSLNPLIRKIETEK